MDNENQPIKNSAFAIRLPLMLSIAFCLGLLLGVNMYKPGGVIPSNKVKRVVKRINDILEYVDEYYVDEVDVETLGNHGIEKILEQLDPHSAFIPAEESELVNAPLKSGFEGIGVEFMIFRDTISVIKAIFDGPSDIAGIRSGDKIVEVEGEAVAGIGIDNRGVIDMLRGEKGTKVEVGIYRRGYDSLMNFVITRNKIPTYSVEVSFMLEDKIGYIKLTRFASSTYEEMLKAIKKLKAEGMDKLILDLRDNGGGYLDKAIDLADEFIAGEKLIMYTDGKGERFDDTYYAKRAGVFEEGKLIVLVDENSASAAEILSGALQDNDRALIVGRRSYGKGLVQKPITLKDKSELRLTISRYYTPSGRSIQRSYAEGVEAYFDDINERYTHGELFSKDSVHFPDSLKYTTGNGRVVYGGGGIMPDVFIPADTGVVSGALRKVYAEGAHREFAVQYAATNKSMLSSMSFEAFRRNAAFGQEMLEAFKIFLAERGMEEITSTKEQEKLLKLLMAFVARNVWDDEGFYPIYLQDDKTLNISKTLFDDIEDRLNGQ